LHQGLGNDPDDTTAGFKGGLGDDTHQTSLAPAINQLATVLANPQPHLLGGPLKFWPQSQARPAEDA